MLDQWAVVRTGPQLIAARWGAPDFPVLPETQWRIDLDPDWMEISRQKRAVWDAVSRRSSPVERFILEDYASLDEAERLNLRPGLVGERHAQVSQMCSQFRLNDS